MSSMGAIRDGFGTLIIDPSQRLRSLRIQMEAAEARRRVSLNRKLSQDSSQARRLSSSSR